MAQRLIKTGHGALNHLRHGLDRIDAVQPVAEVIQGTMTGFYESLGHLQGYASP